MLLVSLLLMSCQTQTRQGGEESTVDAGAWPEFDYSMRARDGFEVYSLDPESRIDVLVRRDGPLARFGHDHVVSITLAEGFLFLARPLSGSRADLRFDVAQMEVDDAALRAFYQLETQPDDDDIEATRANMLSKVLYADQWPGIFLSLSGFRTEAESFSADLVITVGENLYRSRENFHLSRSGQGVTVSGQTTLKQTDLGLEPFSTLGGGLRVADTLEVYFSIQGNLQK